MRLIGDKINIISEGFCYKPPVGCFGFATSVLISDDINILFDTGNYGLRKEINNLIKKIKIDYVVISHLHFDHCSNLDLFINSDTRIIISADELEYYDEYNNKDLDLFSYFDSIKDKLKIQTPNNGQSISKNCRIVYTGGHTKGHISLEVIDNGKIYLLCGDSIKTRKEISKFPTYTNCYDIDIAKKTYADILKKYDNLILGHDIVFSKKLKLRRF